MTANGGIVARDDITFDAGGAELKGFPYLRKQSAFDTFPQGGACWLVLNLVVAPPLEAVVLDMEVAPPEARLQHTWHDQDRGR